MAMVMSFTFLAGCTEDAAKEDKAEKKEKVTINVHVPEGLPSLSIAKMIKDKPNIEEGYEINYSIEKTADTLVSKVLNNEADIAIVPSTLPAQAMNKGLDYKLAGTAGWGSLYLVSSEDIMDIKDIKGKEVYTIGKGLTPDVMFRYILSSKNIDGDKELTLTYLNGVTELAPAFISGKTKIALVPEPMLSTILSKKPDTKIIMNLNDQWKKAQNSEYGYPQSSILVKGKIASEHKEFLDKFLKEYENAMIWANENPEELGTYSEELKLSLAKELAPKVMKNANIKYVSIDKCKDDYNKYYEVLKSFAPKSIGGKIPDEGLYLQK